MTRFDVIYRGHSVSIEPHFCREWDEDGGCYGTNPEHGLSLEDACCEVADWHEKQAQMWREQNHPSIDLYITDREASNVAQTNR